MEKIYLLSSGHLESRIITFLFTFGNVYQTKRAISWYKILTFYRWNDLLQIKIKQLYPHIQAQWALGI